MFERRWRHDGRRLLLPILISKLGPFEDFDPMPAIALIDTGATRSGVCQPIVQRLSLDQIGSTMLQAATDDRPVPIYFCWMAVACDEDASGDDAPSSRPVFFEAHKPLGFRASKSFDAVLGMDVLGQCDLHLERSGFCTLRVS